MMDVAGFKKERRPNGAAVAGFRKVRTIVAATAPAIKVAPHAGRDPIYAILGNGGTIAQGIPGYRERDRQLRLAEFAADCIRTGEHGIGEAGTGVGKSYAYLVAAILSGRQTIVAVPTIALQTQLIEKDLPALARPGIMPRRFTYALLKGRRNYACRLKADRFFGDSEIPEFGTTEVIPVADLLTAAEWYHATTDGDLGKLSVQLPMAIRNEITADSSECLGEKCPKFDGCYGESAKSRAKDADVIVTNYALLLLDMRLRSISEGIVSLVPDAPVRIFDECHRLPDVARDAFTLEVTESRWHSLSRRARRLVKIGEQDTEVTNADAIAGAWLSILATLDANVTQMFEGYAERVKSNKDTATRLGDEIETMHTVMTGVHTFRVAMMNAAPAWITGDDRKSWDKVAENMGAFIDDMWDIARPRETLDYVAVADVETDGDNERVTLSFVPVDVAPILRAHLYGRGGVTISVSATVTEGGTFDYYREQVGLTNCRTVDVGSMFDYYRDTLLYVPAKPAHGDDATFNPTIARQDPDLWRQYLDNLADETVRLVNMSKGRALVLFTSREVMRGVYDRVTQRNQFPGRLPYPVIKQGDAPMPVLVEQFKSQPTVLFGLKTYWEGFDIPGPMLSLVIICGIPFVPPTDPVYAARCELAQARYGRGAHFRKIAIPEATMNLKQGFGRGKRTDSDRAVVTILDTRLRTAGYGERIMHDLPNARQTDDSADVRRFFE